MIKAIFATDIKGSLGLNQTLPWPNDSEDMKRFKSLTVNQIVVMGSNTWNDPLMPKPLPNRMCIVVSSQDPAKFSQAHLVIDGHNLLEDLENLEHNHPEKTIWIIGGAKLLESCKPLLKEIYLTMFMKDFKCDVKLNLNSYLQNFTMLSEEFGLSKTFTRWARE
jgi:dihydrofolate reductase